MFEAGIRKLYIEVFKMFPFFLQFLEQHLYKLVSQNITKTIFERRLKQVKTYF